MHPESRVETASLESATEVQHSHLCKKVAFYSQRHNNQTEFHMSAKWYSQFVSICTAVSAEQPDSSVSSSHGKETTDQLPISSTFIVWLAKTIRSRIQNRLMLLSTSVFAPDLTKQLCEAKITALGWTGPAPSSTMTQLFKVSNGAATVVATTPTNSEWQEHCKKNKKSGKGTNTIQYVKGHIMSHPFCAKTCTTPLLLMNIGYPVIHS